MTLPSTTVSPYEVVTTRYGFHRQRLGHSNFTSSLLPTTASSIEVATPSEAVEGCVPSEFVTVNTIIDFQQKADTFLLVATIISSILQVYVMTAAIKHVRRKTADKCMHVFLFSMTFADFILTAINYPLELGPRAGLIPAVSRFLNQTMHISCWVALIVSSLSLVFLNLDKLFYFRFPLRYATIFTRARAIMIITAFWIFSFLFVVFAWLTQSFHCVDEDCLTLAIFEGRMHIYVPFTFCVGVLPTVTSLVVAVYIMKVVSFHRRQLAEEQALYQPHPPVDGSGSHHPHHRTNSMFTTRLRTFYFIFMSTVFTAVTLLPYRLAGLQRSLNPSKARDCSNILTLWIMMYMIYLHSIINPFLTITVLPQYRVNFLKIFDWCSSTKEYRKTATTSGTPNGVEM